MTSAEIFIILFIISLPLAGLLGWKMGGRI